MNHPTAASLLPCVHEPTRPADAADPALPVRRRRLPEAARRSRHGGGSFQAQATADTPLGPVTLAATEAGLAGLWFEGQRHHPGPLPAPVDPRQRWIVQALAELAAYWRGNVSFGVPLDPQGTPFQREVWAALRRIAPGATLSYGALAQAIGRAAAVRAVGAAVGRNPISVIVPCHRVLGADGTLTGYAGGVDRKAALLKLERALAR